MPKIHSGSKQRPVFRTSALPRRDRDSEFGISFSSNFAGTRGRVFSFSKQSDTDTGDRFPTHLHTRMPAGASICYLGASISALVGCR